MDDSNDKREGIFLSGTIRSGETMRIGHLYDKSTETGLNPENVLIDRALWARNKQKITQGVSVVFHSVNSSIPSVRIISASARGANNQRVSVAIYRSEIVNLNG